MHSLSHISSRLTDQQDGNFQQNKSTLKNGIVWDPWCNDCKSSEKPRQEKASETIYWRRGIFRDRKLHSDLFIWLVVFIRMFYNCGAVFTFVIACMSLMTDKNFLGTNKTLRLTRSEVPRAIVRRRVKATNATSTCHPRNRKLTSMVQWGNPTILLNLDFQLLWRHSSFIRNSFWWRKFFRMLERVATTRKDRTVSIFFRASERVRKTSLRR